MVAVVGVGVREHTCGVGGARREGGGVQFNVNAEVAAVNAARLGVGSSKRCARWFIIGSIQQQVFVGGQKNHKDWICVGKCFVVGVTCGILKLSENEGFQKHLRILAFRYI